MRILYFNYLWDIYGASIGSAIKPLELFAALEELGHTVQICWMKKQPQQENSGAKAKSNREFLKKYFARYVHDAKLFAENIPFRKAEQEWVEKFKPDIIVARLDLYLFSALRTARKNKLPIIIEADCPPVYEAVEFQKQYFRIPIISEKIEKYVLKNADFVITQSNVLHDHFSNRYQLDLKKMAVAPNAVVPEKFQINESDEELRKKYDLKSDPVVGFVGSMSVWHGIENLQKIILNIVAKIPHVKFLLVGTGGGNENKLSDFLRKNNLEKNVVFTGYVPHKEIPKHIGLFDVALAPYPGLDFFYYSPVKMFEYMAAGKPMVTTDIGQIAEVITNNFDGILCRPDNIDELINSTLLLLENEKERKRIGENARLTIKNKHTWQHRANQWNKAINMVVKKQDLEIG